jgi:hypothetical protein
MVSATSTVSTRTDVDPPSAGFGSHRGPEQVPRTIRSALATVCSTVNV